MRGHHQHHRICVGGEASRENKPCAGCDVRERIRIERHIAPTDTRAEMLGVIANLGKRDHLFLLRWLTLPNRLDVGHERCPSWNCFTSSDLMRWMRVATARGDKPVISPIVAASASSR